MNANLLDALHQASSHWLGLARELAPELNDMILWLAFDNVPSKSQRATVVHDVHGWIEPCCNDDMRSADICCGLRGQRASLVGLRGKAASDTIP